MQKPGKLKGTTTQRGEQWPSSGLGREMGKSFWLGKRNIQNRMRKAKNKNKDIWKYKESNFQVSTFKITYIRHTYIYTYTHIYNLNDNFSSGLTMLPPWSKYHLTNPPIPGMRSSLLNCCSGLSKRLLKWHGLLLLPLRTHWGGRLVPNVLWMWCRA